MKIVVCIKQVPDLLISRFGKVICRKSGERFQSGTLADIIQTLECQLVRLPRPGLGFRIPQQNLRITNDSMPMVITHVLTGRFCIIIRGTGIHF